MDFTKLKRKKKKPTFNLEDLSGALDETQPAKDGLGADGLPGDDDLDFNNMKKKKKKKKVNVEDFEREFFFSLRVSPETTTRSRSRAL